jgi:23S rRNA G2445 N2-methylase RlmL
MRYFATAIPGLHTVLAREIGGLPGVRVDSRREFDGRNDVVSFTATGHDGILGLRTSEDVFVQVATARRRGPLRSIVRELWNQRALEQALSTYGASVQPLRARMRFRVVTRVRSEREFLRTALRDELIRQVQQRRPRWRVADPAAIELWALETSPGLFRFGVRLSSSSMRHRAGRTVERPGALRPTVAAAMLLLADRKVASQVVLDPCCGSGTILAEATALGWEPVGADIDVEAIGVARHNLGKTARLLLADVRHLPLADESVTATVSNLPFGKQYPLQDDPRSWFAATLDELVRVTRPSSAVVVLVPRTPTFERVLASRPTLALTQRLDLRLLGVRTALWVLRRP